MTISGTCTKCRKPLGADDSSGVCGSCLGAGLMDVLGIEPEPVEETVDRPMRPSGSRRGRTILGDYELLDQIGRGGMGIVYRARHLDFNRTVALKIVHAGPSRGVGAGDRLKQEAELASTLDHPNIVPVHEVGETDGRAWFTMKLIDGANLAERLEEFSLADTGTVDAFEEGIEGREVAASRAEAVARLGLPVLEPSTPIRLAVLMAKVSRAVHHAHQRGILHRDIKPSNILVDRGGEPHVTDFGLARRSDIDPSVTVTGAMLGTPAYVAPEVAREGSRAAAVAADVYGIGAVLYHLLTGRPPFEGATSFEILQRVCQREVTHPGRLVPSVPSDLATICLKSLEKNPARRYPTALEIAEELERFIRGEPIRARPPSRLQRVARWCQRRPTATAFALVAVAVAVAGVLGVGWLWRRAEGSMERLNRRAMRLQVEQAEQLLRHGNVPEAVARFANLWRDGGSPRAVVDRMMGLIERERLAFPMGRPMRPGGRVLAFAVNRDGGLVATASDDGVASVWSGVTGEQRAAPLRHDGPVVDLAFSPDGSRLATASEDRRVRVWDARTGKALTPWMVHPAAVRKVRFDPTGRWVVSAAADETVRIWDAATGEPKSPRVSMGVGVRELLFPDGGAVLWIAAVQGPVRILSMPDGQELSPLRLETSESMVHAVALPGVEVAVMASDEGWAVWNLRERRLVCRVSEVEVPDLFEFDPVARRVIVGTTQGGAAVWDIGGRYPARVMTLPGEPRAVAFSADGAWIGVGETGRVQVIDGVHGGRVVPAIPHPGTVVSLRFSPDGTRLFTLDQASVVRIWNLGNPAAPPARFRTRLQSLDGMSLVGRDDGAMVWSLRPDGVEAIEVERAGGTERAIPSPDAGVLQAVAVDRSNRVWTASWDGARVRVYCDGDFRAEKAFGTNAVQCQFGPGAASFAIRSAGRDGVSMAFWNPVGNWADVASGAALREAARVVLDPSGRSAAVKIHGHRILVFRTSDARLRWMPYDHGSEVRDVRFDESGNRIVVAGEDGVAVVLDTQTGSPVSGPYLHDTPLALARFDAGTGATTNLLLTVTGDGAVRAWDLGTSGLRFPPLQHGAAVSALAISGDGRSLATASEDGVVRLWDPQSGFRILDLSTQTTGTRVLEFSSDSRVLVAGSRDGEIVSWPVVRGSAAGRVPDWLPEFAEGLAGAKVRDDQTVRELGPETRLSILNVIAGRDVSEPWVGWARRRQGLGEEFE